MLHVLVAVAVVVLVNLGFWQLRRLDDVRSNNELLAERLARPVLGAEELATLDPAEQRFRRVELTGAYDTASEVLHLNRDLDGRNGHHVVTPLRTSSGLVVLVSRGWVPFALDDPPVAEAAPAAPDVTVRGVLRESQAYSSFGPRDASGGYLERLVRLNVDRIAEQLDDVRTHPLWLQLEAQTPPQPADDPGGLALPVPAARPELDEGNHLSYAVQWFLFATVAVVGYGAYLRKVSAPTDGSGMAEAQDQGGRPHSRHRP